MKKPRLAHQSIAVMVSITRLGGEVLGSFVIKHSAIELLLGIKHAAFIKIGASVFFWVVAVAVMPHSHIDGVQRTVAEWQVRLVASLSEEQGMVGTVLGVSERVGGDGLEQGNSTVRSHGDERVQLHQQWGHRTMMPAAHQQ
ncbi:MAG: hypothetical protein IJM58_08010 [Muribaculaceae bacterium]|nr:hypothetical protein [Muribaculaceae bacterium]